jgi:urea transport system ATP-binding protein
MGRNGMGKTTLFKALIGILPTKSATSSVDGKKSRRTRVHAASRQGHRVRAAGPDDLPDADGGGEHPDRLENAKVKKVPDDIYALFPVLFDMRRARAATCPAASSSSWRSPARW